MRAAVGIQEFLLNILQTRRVVHTLFPRVLLDRPCLVDAIDDGPPRRLKSLDLHRASRRQARRHLRLLHRIPCVLDQHLIGLLVKL